MTSVSKILCDYCLGYVDDIRLSDLLAEDTALFFRRMFGYFRLAVPLFTLPAEMPEYLLGTKEEPKFKESIFLNTAYTTEKSYDGDIDIHLGPDFSDYDICSCRIRESDALGNIFYTPVSSSYDSASGDVTVHPENGEILPVKTVLEFDFYKDGYFENDLSPEIMNILGMCFQVIWQDRFNTDWLSNVSKTEDRSFFEQNRANKMKADTERLKMLREKLAGEMRRFEQNRYYNKIMSRGKRLKF